MSELKFGQKRGLSHAYIAASLSEDTRSRTVKVLSAAAVCSADNNKPCGACRDCRKAQDGVHPDIIHIRRETDEKGKARKEIRVDQVRDMIAQAQIMANEANGKAFVIHEAELMNTQAQNALLKLLEEPPRGVVLILSTATPTMLLETVRSRCIEISENDAAPPPDEALRKDVLRYLELTAKGSRGDLLAWCNQKAGSTDVAGANAFVDAVKFVLTDILCGREQGHGPDKNKCWALLELMETCTEYLAVNTGVKHVFGMISLTNANRTRF